MAKKIDGVIDQADLEKRFLEKGKKARLKAESTMAAATNASPSMLIEEIAICEILMEELIENRKKVETEVLNTIDAMGVAFDQKVESIQKLRDWRKTIEHEARLASAAMDRIARLTKQDNVRQMDSLVRALREIGSIDTGGLIGRVFPMDHNNCTKE